EPAGGMDALGILDHSPIRRAGPPDHLDNGFSGWELQCFRLVHGWHASLQVLSHIVRFQPALREDGETPAPASHAGSVVLDRCALDVFKPVVAGNRMGRLAIPADRPRPFDDCGAERNAECGGNLLVSWYAP